MAIDRFATLKGNSEMMNRDNPVWLITGCSTGFGRELAKLVLARGWRALVTARDPSTLADIAAGHNDRALILPLDVTRRAQIAEVVAQARRRFGRIDVLVNNAGYGYLAAIEEGEDEAVRAMFETNVFGLVDMTKAVLPLMREQRSASPVLRQPVTTTERNTRWKVSPSRSRRR